MSEATQGPAPLVEVREIQKFFPISGGLLGRTVNHVRAVDGVSFDIYAGETLSLVGESGCRKSTVGRCVARLLDLTSGALTLDGIRVDTLPERSLKSFRRRLNLVFEDPFSSLNPRMNVEALVSEPLRSHGIGSSRADRNVRVAQLLETVELSPDIMDRMSHQFSGGQRQRYRLCIARALASEPTVIICDEAVSALDVSVQAQIINLPMQLQSDLDLAILFISHDLAVVEHLSNRVAVMYLCRIMEIADRDTLFSSLTHPYTKALLSAVPLPDPSVHRDRVILKGEVPSPINSPTGCPFRTRCPIATDLCAAERPDLIEYRPGQSIACHYPG